MSPTALLLPGNMCDARLWQGDDGAIRAMLARHAIAARHPELTQDDSIVAMAARALRDTPGSLLPIGFSMGAIVALEMARQAPDRIVGLVLIGVNASADLPDRARHRPVQQAEVRAGGLERVLVEELMPNYLAAARRDDRALLDVLRDMGLALGADVFVRQSEALRLRGDLIAALASLKCPVLLIAGDEDALCPPAWHERWAGLIADATLHVVAGAGHMVPLEAPSVVAALIANWLKDKMWATPS